MVLKNKETPTGVKVVSTYYIIASALTAIFGLIVLIFSKKAIDYVISISPELTTFEPVVLANAITIAGILAVIFGIIGIILGIGLFKLKAWARWTILLLTLFGFFMAITGLVSGEFSNIIGLLINGFIAWYLVFNKQAKTAFK